MSDHNINLSRKPPNAEMQIGVVAQWLSKGKTVTIRLPEIYLSYANELLSDHDLTDKEKERLTFETWKMDTEQRGKPNE